MAFETIPQALIDVGAPVVKELFQLTKDNFDNIDPRITLLEANDKRVVVLNDFIVNANIFSSYGGFALWKSPQAFTLTEAKIGIFSKGTLTGVVEVDIKKGTSLNPASFSTVFTTRPSITFASVANYAESTNAVFDNTAKNVAVGNYLLFNLSTMPSGGVLGALFVQTYGEI